MWKQSDRGITGLRVGDVSWLLHNRRNWVWGDVGAGICGQVVKEGLRFFANACVWICWGCRTSMRAEWATMRTFSWSQGGRRGEDRKPNYVACSTWIRSGWLVVAWWLPVTICQTCLPCLPGGWIWLNIGAWWGRAKCFVQQLEREINPKSILD